MKNKKCSYIYCDCPYSLDDDEAVYDNGKYYHLSCFEKKEAKIHVYNLFCDYVTNKESGLFIKKKIRDFIDNEKFAPTYMEFTMQYIILKQIPLQSIWGLKKVMEQPRVQRAYAQCIDKYQTPHINIETKEFEFTNDKQRGWRDLIG